MPRVWTPTDMLRLVADRYVRDRWAAELIEAGADLGDWGWMQDARLLDPPARRVADPVAAGVHAVAARMRRRQEIAAGQHDRRDRGNGG